MDTLQQCESRRRVTYFVETRLLSCDTDFLMGEWTMLRRTLLSPFPAGFTETFVIACEIAVSFRWRPLSSTTTPSTNRSNVNNQSFIIFLLLNYSCLQRIWPPFTKRHAPKLQRPRPMRELVLEVSSRGKESANHARKSLCASSAGRRTSTQS
jgi:hypothetical protein